MEETNYLNPIRVFLVYLAIAMIGWLYLVGFLKSGYEIVGFISWALFSGFGTGKICANMGYRVSFFSSFFAVSIVGANVYFAISFNDLLFPETFELIHTKENIIFVLCLFVPPAILIPLSKHIYPIKIIQIKTESKPSQSKNNLINLVIAIFIGIVLGLSMYYYSFHVQ